MNPLWSFCFFCTSETKAEKWLFPLKPAALECMKENNFGKKDARKKGLQMFRNNLARKWDGKATKNEQKMDKALDGWELFMYG